MTEADVAEAGGIAQRRDARVRVLDADRIALCWGSSTELVPWSEIISVRSVRNYALITARGRTIKVRGTLRAVLAELGALGLMQVRRDTAVNITYIRRLVGAGRHRLLVILHDDCSIAVGREFQHQVRAQFASRLVR